MTTDHSYRNPPIAEAVVEIRIRTEREPDLDRLAELGTKMYPHREDIYLLAGQFAIQEGTVGATAQRTRAGYAFKSQDGTSLISARTDLFAFSRYAPYVPWASFSQDARTHWERYRSVVQPLGVVRVALRYINKIRLPSAQVDLKDYLRTFPEISPEMPQELAGYVMRLEMPYQEFEANLILNQSALPPDSPESVSLLLDIDVFQMGEPPISAEEAWQRLERLRVLKNQVFEACITPRTRELFG